MSKTILNMKINNNITEGHCSLEVSKLLKEKGFNIECTYHFCESINPEIKISRFKVENTYWDNVKNNYYSPTHALAIEWLRVNFGQHIEALHRGDLSDYTFLVGVLRKPALLIKEEPHYMHDEGYNTPQEATEAALLYVLQNLVK